MSTMSQLGEFIATIQNNQDVRTAALEERLAQLESKEECGCAETISTLEARLATLEAKEECGCAETISTLEERLAQLESKEECGCAETITALEERLATLESKDECGCGSYDELLASYEERISALEGNGGGSTEGEGGSTEGEGEGENSGNTEPIPASQALEEYDHLLAFKIYKGSTTTPVDFVFISTYGIKCVSSLNTTVSEQTTTTSMSSILGCNKGDIVKVYTPDLQEIEIIADSTSTHGFSVAKVTSIAIGNKETKEVYCYDVDLANKTISPCTDEAFIAQWGNSDALGL